MPFPGNRTFKLRRPIKASVITGELNFDGVFCLTHADFIDFAPNAITLDHADAMQQGGVDLAVSSDEAGNNRLALEIVRCELNATPANSRLEIWVRVPFVSDTVDTDVWIWWGDATETQPAVDADYGRNDVWNGTTGDGVPIVSNRIVHFSEPATNPSPQWADSSGNDKPATLTDSAPTEIDLDPGQGQLAAGIRMTDGHAPGTSNYAVIVFFSRPSSTAALDAFYSAAQSPHYFGSFIVNDFYRVDCGSKLEIFTWGSNITSPTMAVQSRDGDTMTVVGNDQFNLTKTGFASENVGTVGDAINFANPVSNIGYSFFAILDCAPNVNWYYALYHNVVPKSLWDTTYAPEPAAVTATIVFDSLNAGTEVRVYEQPHPQVWSFDLDGATPAGLALTYIQFQIQGESSASECYFWFRLDGAGTDPAPGGTGYRVDVVTGDTDAEMAEAAQAVLTAVTDLGATVSGTVVTVTNDRNGELTTPVDGGTDAPIALIQCGGTATDEIDGIESSTGTSWTANYTILRPRRCTIAMLSIAYENVRYSTILTTAGLVVPAGALQREDRNYYNPT